MSNQECADFVGVNFMVRLSPLPLRNSLGRLTIAGLVWWIKDLELYVHHVCG